jgi:hypothetical protein
LGFFWAMPGISSTYTRYRAQLDKLTALLK